MSRVAGAWNRATRGKEQAGKLAGDDDDRFSFEVGEFPTEATPTSDDSTSRMTPGALPVTDRTDPPAPTADPVPPSESRGGRSLIGKLVGTPEFDPVAREQYRKLAAGFHRTQLQTGIKVLMVTSALAGEGKTLTVANLGLTLSQAYGRQVLLVDADLRKPSLHRVFDLPNTAGLGEILSARTAPPPASLGSRLSLVPAGSVDADPLTAFGSNRLRPWLDWTREHFDWVLLDTPPLALLSDTHLLSSAVDAAVLVVTAGRTPYPLVREAADAIGEERLAGVVLNRTQAVPAAQYYGYGYGYREYADR